VIEVPSSVRLDPPPHPFRPIRRRTDASVKKSDCAPSRGDLLAMTDGELAAFLGAFDEPSEAEWKENYEEAYWRSARNSFEYVRLLRLIHPTARQLVMTADEAVDFYRRITHGPRTEAQRQADFKILSREQRGPKSGSTGNVQDDKYLALWRNCLRASGPNLKRRAERKFIQEATKRREEGGLGVALPTARNNLSLLKKRGAK
jgi:hypothetical protein